MVNIIRPERDEGRALEASLTPYRWYEDTYKLSLSFAGATTGVQAYTNTLYISSTTPLTLDDIVIMDNGVAV
ncbi:hypothetical protein [Sulfitobacter sp.]|uniref:hypothetical protein n=1 Tax=Sulfitobacter sp. TaxID=1903071 RepID=UPI003EF98A5B